MKKKTCAFIDSNNLFQAIRNQGWDIDFARFRRYLTDKYQVDKAYLFIGYMDERKSLYSYLENSGYTLIFKKILRMRDGKIKGNCDAELVLHTMIQFPYYDGAIIVSNDGDFCCLIEYLAEMNKLERIIIPDAHRYSSLLKPFVPFMHYMNDLKEKLTNKKPSQ